MGATATRLRRPASIIAEVSIAGRGGVLRARAPLAAVVALGAGLRLFHLTSLSLWVDEGLTVRFARLPWAALLGHPTAYGIHPPLYYMAVKLMALLAPETVAGRLVSAAAGTLTIVALYALASRLVSPRAALLAALALALSPLHIWYSQEARPYALVALFVTLSYLALIAALQGGRRAWVPAYGLTLLLALYTDVSAIFALAPQVLVLAVAVAARGDGAQRALALTGAALFAALGFLPWLPRLLRVAGPASTQAQFGISPARVWDTLLSASGLAANQSVFDGAALPPWIMWPGAHAALLGAVALTLAAGLAALARRSSMSLAVAVGLLAGTVVVAVGIGLVYPSFAERTVLPVVLGVAIVVGAAASASSLPRGLSLLGGLGAAGVLAASLVTIGALDTDAYKQHWDLLAADTAAAARLGWPVVAYPTVAATLIDLYQPLLRGRALLTVDDGGALPALDDANDGRDEAVWLAYVPAAGIARLQSQFAQQGYRRILHTYYPYPLYLDLYARADAPLGRDVSINGRFTGTARHATGWFLTRPDAAFEDEEGGRRLALTAAAGAETIASTAVPAREGRLYTLRYRARVEQPAANGRVFLICATERYAFLDVAPDAAGAPIDDQDGAWHEGRLAVMCPAATRLVQVELRSERGTVDVDRLSLREARPVS